MYYRDHAPPHFHAIYGQFEAEIEIASASIMQGSLPRRAKSLVIEWAKVHQGDLIRDWELARAGQPLNPVEPLE